MNVTLTPSDNGFDVAHPALPGPICLTHEVGRQFTKALVSPELDVPAFKTDKNIWAPQTREPLGLWLTEAGQIELWIAGQIEVLTKDEARALAGDVLLASATYKVGDELETKDELILFDRVDIDNDEAASALRTNTAPRGSFGTVAAIQLVGDRVGYRLEIDGRFTYAMNEDYFKVAPPIQTYRITRDLARCTSDHVEVQARSADAARKLADKARAPAGYEITDIYEIEVVTATDAELNEQEGFVANSDGTLGLTADSQHATPAALTQFLLEKAFAGSRRHQQIVRDTIVAT